MFCLALQALHERTNTELETSDVAHVVNLEQRERLAMTLHDVTDFILDEAVRTAAEAGHLNEMYIVALLSSPLSRLHDAVHVCPLLHEVSLSYAMARVVLVAFRLRDVSGDVVADDVHAQVGDHL